MEPRDTRCSRLSWSWQRLGTGVYQRSQLQMHDELLLLPSSEVIMKSGLRSSKGFRQTKSTDRWVTNVLFSFFVIWRAERYVNTFKFRTNDPPWQRARPEYDEPWSKSSPVLNGKSSLDDNCGAVVSCFPSKGSARRSANGMELPNSPQGGTRLNGDGTWRLWWDFQKLCSNLSDRNWIQECMPDRTPIKTSTYLPARAEERGSHDLVFWFPNVGLALHLESDLPCFRLGENDGKTMSFHCKDNTLQRLCTIQWLNQHQPTTIILKMVRKMIIMMNPVAS